MTFERIKPLTDGLSTVQVADYFGVSVPLVVKWRSGQRTPSDTVVKLVEILETIQVLNPALFEAVKPKP